jgi:sortase (surface protein transpeptidase)
VVATPVRVVIPDLGIDGPVIPAGVNSDSELDVPPDARTLVWYRHGPSPGEPGSAVIAGHLNWRGVNGLFAKLDETPVGALITIVYDDGSERSFTVSTVELLPKPAVAVNGVFARDGERLLRLVTCGGEFEKAVRSYRSNVVVTAVPA